MFNKNRSCIEISFFSFSLFLIKSFNKNRSCIEIPKMVQDMQKLPWFNKNRSCIEIIINNRTVRRFTRLIKTEVVLKYSFMLICSKIRLCLIKTEVVLKFGGSP